MKIASIEPVLLSIPFEDGGSGMGNFGAVVATPDPSHGFPSSAALVLPPLSTIYLEYDPD